MGKPSGALAVHLAPPPSIAPTPPPAPMTQGQPAQAHQASSPRSAPRLPSSPRVLAFERRSASSATPPPAQAAQPPAAGDLASYIEARRRSREPQPEPAQPPVESEQERNNRIAAANLGLNVAPSFGSERKIGGGIFQIERVTFDEAEFFFYGWNKDIRRNARQMISVQRGGNPSIEIAVVRKMIAIIRERSTGDFLWESPRLNRTITLSARPEDNAGLEDFMMNEFFPDGRRRR